MKPIIFSTPMVQAILDGRKTQTRRAIKYDFESVYSAASQQGIMDKVCQYGELPSDAIEWYAKNIAKPKYQPGDVLWVRETWTPFCVNKKSCRNAILAHPDYCYKATVDKDCVDKLGCKWRPSIHMPRDAARIFLRVTEVRAERLQEITEEDAIAEGISWLDEACYSNNGWTPTLYDPDSGGSPVFRDGFIALWDSINAKRGYSWDTNPWVWVIEFERCDKEEKGEI
jgi:hypothetical protein